MSASLSTEMSKMTLPLPEASCSKKQPKKESANQVQMDINQEDNVSVGEERTLFSVLGNLNFCEFGWTATSNKPRGSGARDKSRMKLRRRWARLEVVASRAHLRHLKASYWGKYSLLCADRLRLRSVKANECAKALKLSFSNAD